MKSIGLDRIFQAGVVVIVAGISIATGLLLAGQVRSIEIGELAATEVKKAITGRGHSTKHQVQQAVMAQCSLSELPEPPDVADAIAIALCAARRIAAERVASVE